MSFLKKFFGGKDRPTTRSPAEEVEQHAVLLYLKTAGEMPPQEEMNRYHRLQDEIAKAVNAKGVGELDGDEWGDGRCTVYLYGPNAERLWDAIAPVIEKHPLPHGSVAIKRFGGPGCAKAEQIMLGWDG
ncbi:MAG: hypothetical protein ACKVW3_15740 [Phycisphaerales bacterium]